MLMPTNAEITYYVVAGIRINILQYVGASDGGQYPVPFHPYKQEKRDLNCFIGYAKYVANFLGLS